MTTTVRNTKIGQVENKIPDPSDSVTTTILNIKIGELENKIPRDSGLVATAVLNTKTDEVQNKYSDHAKSTVTLEFDKLAGSIFNKKLKQTNLATNSDKNAVHNVLTKIKRKFKNYKRLI